MPLTGSADRELLCASSTHRCLGAPFLLLGDPPSPVLSPRTPAETSLVENSQRITFLLLHGSKFFTSAGVYSVPLM